MILITSAAYVTPGLVAEFGQMPPCMLPLQNKRLYVHQIELLKTFNEDVILSLPQNYVPSDYDVKELHKLGVQIVNVPKNLSLGASVIYVLNILSRFNEPLRILHGDTLLGEIPSALDACSVSVAQDDYSWASADMSTDNLVYTGFFSFSSQPYLIRSITEQDYSFIKGVEQYRERHPMQNIPTSEWFDFGIVNSYYRSKSKLTTQRAFNDLQISSYSVTKRSKDINKMQAEANWFKSIPASLKHFTPALWNDGIEGDKGFYEIEYFYLCSLAELFVFGNNPFFVWKSIIDSCADFILQVSEIKPSNAKEIAQQSIALYGAKTTARLQEYANAKGIDLDHIWTINGEETPSLNNIVEDINKELVKPQEKYVGILHGDFCFSNILYDFKSLSIKVLDPRGRDLDGNMTIYGDIRYDVAKLAHSVIGLYDYIIGGFYDCSSVDEYNLTLNFSTSPVEQQLKEYFLSQQFGGYSCNDLSVYPIMIHLFLSMLPLHSDRPDRQRAMLANALRLYIEYKQQ